MGAMFEFPWLPLTFRKQNLCVSVWGVFMQSEKIKCKTRRPRTIYHHKRVPTCSLSILSWLISRSFFWSSSCCCWISSKCSNKSWRKWVTWLASVLWLELSWTISGSGNFENETLSLGWSCSFSTSLLMLLCFRDVEDFERKTRVNCRSDRALEEVVGALFPENGTSAFTCVCSMFPPDGKSVVITIW